MSVIAVSACGIYLYQVSSSEQAGKKSVKIIELPKGADTTKDTDGDGLLDWEEALYKTDFKKADPDGDGTNDNQEIGERRDPLTPGPNDYIRAIGEYGQSVLSSEEELTETEKMMRGMLTIIGRLPDPKQKGVKESVAKSIVDTLDEKSRELPNSFTRADLKSVSETPESLIRYGNALGAVLKQYEDPKTEQAKMLTATAYEMKGSSGPSKEEFDSRTALKKKAAAAIKKIPVPESLLPYHLALLNNFANTPTVIENLEYVVKDPLRGLVGIKQYKSIVEEHIGLRQKIREHIDNSGAVFGEGEDGFLI